MPLPRLIIAIVLLTGLFARPAVAAANAPWTLEPAANQYGAARQSYGYTVNPGGEVQDGVVVANSGATPLHLTLRAADAFTNGAGKLDLRVAAAKLGAWVHLGQGDVTVPAGASAVVPFTLTLPKNAASGDYMGGIVSAGAGQHADVQIRLRIGGSLRPSLAVEGVKLHYAATANPFGEGGATVSYTIRNTGNAILTAHQAVSAAGPFGRWKVKAGTVADSPPLLPGATWKVSAPLHDVTPAVRTTATVTLTPLLTDASGSIAPLAAVKASGHALTVPWTLLIGVLVLLALFVLAAVRVRRRVGVPAAVR